MPAANRSTTLRATPGDGLKKCTWMQRPTSSECGRYAGVRRYGCAHVVLYLVFPSFFSDR